MARRISLEDAYGPSQRARNAATRGLAWDLMQQVNQRPQYDAERQPDGIINLSGALNGLMNDWMRSLFRTIAPEIQSEDVLSYGSISGTPELQDAAAGFFNTFFNPSTAIRSNQILATNGVTSLIDLMAWTLCNPGEAALYPTPNFYMLDFDLATRNGVITLPITCTHMTDPFGIEDPTELISAFEMAVEEAEHQRGLKCRVLFICNPSNPQGRCYSKKALEAMVDFCASRHMHLVADEIYALSQYSTDRNQDVGMSAFSSVLSVGGKNALSPHSMVHCLYGLSKDFNMGGLRMGFLATRNEQVLAAVGRITWFTWVTKFSVLFATRFLEQTDHIRSYLDTYHARLIKAYETVANALDECEIPFAESHAGLFIYVNLTRWVACFESSEEHTSEIQLALWLCDYGVFLNPGQFAESDIPGYFRLVFTEHSTELVVLAVKRLRQALDQLQLGTCADSLPRPGPRKVMSDEDETLFDEEQTSLTGGMKAREEQSGRSNRVIARVHAPRRMMAMIRRAGCFK